MADVAVALDVPGRDRALELVEELGSDAELFKVGLELFSREGPGIIRTLRERGARIFLDLKLHDIPSTVAGAVEAAAAEGVELLTVHAVGGSSMLRAAADAAGDRVQLLAVTVLTSMSAVELEATWNRTLHSVRDEVVRLAAMATEAGVAGVVASAHEVVPLRRMLGPDVLLATPGIRLEGHGSHDQERVATPAEAVRAGSDVLVVGRTVTAAPDPRAALRTVLDEVAAAGDHEPGSSGLGPGASP